MPSKWPVRSFGKLIDQGVLELGDGYRAKNDELGGDGLIFLRAGHVTDTHIDFAGVERFHQRGQERFGPKVAQPGDVVVTTKGNSTGRIAFVTKDMPPFVYSPHLSYWRSKAVSVVHPGFLRAWSRSAEFTAQLQAMCRSTDMAPYLSLTDQKQLQVTLPPIAVQTRVAELGDAIEDRIELLRRTNATLESITQALFKSWFIDFDPVRSRAEGLEPEGMDAVTAALFPAGFEQSALGMLPRGWQVAAIQEVVENVYDGPHATPPEATEGPVFLGIKNLTGTSIDLAEVRHIGESDWSRWTKRVTPQADDIVFSYEAALGLFALIPPGLRCCLGRRLALVRPKQVAGTPHFWFHQFIGAPFQQLLNKHTVQGATVNRIALKEFPSFTVVDPGEQLRAAFEAVAKPLWARIHANRQQALGLAELRDTLLPRLISGKLCLPEAQAQLEDALA